MSYCLRRRRQRRVVITLGVSVLGTEHGRVTCLQRIASRLLDGRLTTTATEHVANLTMTATSVGQSQLGDDVIDVLFAQSYYYCTARTWAWS